MGQTILVVDPSPVWRRVVAPTLNRAGYDVVEARDGHDALRKTAVVSFDLVITGHDMPHIDGLTMVRVLRTQPAYAGRPIFLLTDEADDDLKEAARAAGASGWLPRRVDPDALIDVVGAVLGRPWASLTAAGCLQDPSPSRPARPRMPEC